MENEAKEEEVISASAVANYLFGYKKLKGKITNLFLQKLNMHGAIMHITYSASL